MNIFYEWGPAGATTAAQRGDVCILIDIFRASSTIVTALASGFQLIKPVAEIPKSNKNYLCIGEKDCEKIPNCDFGNSPIEILSANKKIQKLLIKTSNGSKCLNNISHDSQCIVLIGCLLNASSTAQAALNFSQKYHKNISFILAGKNGAFCDDDFLAGELIAKLILHQIKTEKLSEDYFHRTREFLLNTEAAQNLINKGLKDDVLFCTQFDKYQTVPIYHPQKKHISELSTESCLEE